MIRREAREQTFVLLFEHTFRPDESMDELVKNAALSRDLSLDDYTVKVYTAAVENWENYSALLSSYLVNWTLERLTRVANVVLHLSLAEMALPEDPVPTGASINEAVELVKKYSNEEDASFVNGVLGSVVRAGFPENQTAKQEEAAEA